jgi:dihydrofolate reductase
MRAAGITIAAVGYVGGPNDGPGKGLGEGGERLHYWVFGGPWTYDDEPKGEPAGEDAAWLAEASSRAGAIVGGRATYEAARHWGDENPFGLPFFIVTHRPEEEPEGGHFTCVSGVEAAVEPWQQELFFQGNVPQKSCPEGVIGGLINSAWSGGCLLKEGVESRMVLDHELGERAVIWVCRLFSHAERLHFISMLPRGAGNPRAGTPA